MTVRFYSSVAPETQLVSTINNSATTMEVVSSVGYPSFTPFTVAIDYETASEELVDVTNAAGNIFTITRGVDGTSATTHNAGARVRHVSSGRDFADSRTHENSDAGVHGLDPGSELVGTNDTQSLSNKTLVDATGTLNRIDILSEGVTGWQTTLNGDIDHNINLFRIKRGPAEPYGVFTVYNTGGLELRNQNVAADTSYNDYRLRIVQSDGTSDIFRILSGGGVDIFAKDPANQALSMAPAVGQTADIMRVQNNALSANLWSIRSDGREIAAKGATVSRTGDATGTILQVGSANVGYTGNLIEALGPSGGIVARIDQTGDLDLEATTWTSFTPAYIIGGSPAMSTNVGWYKALGKIVFFEIYTVFSASGTGTSAVVANLPTTPFRDGNGPATTRQTLSGAISGMATASPGMLMPRVLAGGAGTNITVDLYDFNGIQSDNIQSGTILTIQGWYREA